MTKINEFNYNFFVSPESAMSFSKCLLQINETRALTGNDFKRMFEAALNKIPHKKSKINSFLCCVIAFR